MQKARINGQTINFNLNSLIMKKTSVQFFATFFAFAICMLFASQGFSQTKGTIVKSGTTDAAISVTKIFEFDKGGITFRRTTAPSCQKTASRWTSATTQPTG